MVWGRLDCSSKQLSPLMLVLTTWIAGLDVVGESLFPRSAHPDRYLMVNSDQRDYLRNSLSFLMSL
jgi:hypothetical protein